jgi:hypothetical protein
LSNIAAAKTDALIRDDLRIERTKKLKSRKKGTGVITHHGGEPAPPGLLRRV